MRASDNAYGRIRMTFRGLCDKIMGNKKTNIKFGAVPLTERQRNGEFYGR